MKVNCFLLLFFFTHSLSGQDCKPNTNVKVTLERKSDTISSGYIDSLKKMESQGLVCILYRQFSYNLMPMDSAFKIISFIMYTKSDDGFVNEIPNSGYEFDNRANQYASLVKQGDTLEFACIKAKHKKGLLAYYNH